MQPPSGALSIATVAQGSERRVCAATAVEEASAGTALSPGRLPGWGQIGTRDGVSGRGGQKVRREGWTTLV